MSVVILLRHGRSTANVSGVLAGRADGVELDEVGQGQAAAVVRRLAQVSIRKVVSSPLLRCQQTVAPLATATGLVVHTDERLSEVDYGSWTGRALKELAREELWTTVQRQPSAAVFPDGERLADAAARAVRAARDYGDGGGDGAVVLCSHGDLIKAIVADALGLHVDLFQRVVVGPASVSVIHYGKAAPAVLHVNHPGHLTLPTSPAPAGDAAAGVSAVGGDTGST